MDALKELVKIVNRKRLSKIDVFDKTFLYQNNANLYYKLYEGLESNKITDDASAAEYLYDSKNKDAKYRKLKSRFKNKILKSLLLLDVDEVFGKEQQKKAYYECMTTYYAVETIIKLTGTTKLVYSLIKENYSKAEKFNFYDILKNYSYYLLLYYSLKGDRNSFYSEEKNYTKFYDLANKEQAGKHIYNKIIINFVAGIAITNDLLTSIKNNLDDLNEIKLYINNAEISFYFYYSSLLYFENINDINRILEICNEAEDLLNEQPQITTITRKTAILLYRMKALLHSRQFEKGLELLNRSTNIEIPESSYNWYVLKEFEFKLYLQDNKIDGASHIYKQVLENSSFNRQAAQLTEKWKIYHAYLVFMDNYLNKGEYKFSLSKFLNDVPVNTKDKSGFNFAIRVIEMLFQFARQEYNMVFHKMDALRVYRTRYLNDNTYKRNHLFLSLLIKAEKSGFNAKDMLKINWSEIDELRNQTNYIIADWEIVPYEILWDIFVDLAKK